MGLDRERVRAKVEESLAANPMATNLSLASDSYTSSEILTDAFFAALDEMALQAQERGASGILIPIPKGGSDG